MSSQDCQAGDTTGFPITLSQILTNPWTGIEPSKQNIKLRGLTNPCDFTVNWAPAAQTTISVSQNAEKFQIRGLDSIASGTTLTYGRATYTCSSVLSIVRNQHTNLYNLGNSPGATYEIILAFQINNKSENPSSPDIILMCRPIIFSSWNSIPFLSSVNEAVLRGNTQNTTLDMSSIYGYDRSTLLPMVTYQTCLPTKLFNPSRLGSIKVRVHLTTQPLYVIADENGLAKCSIVSTYIFVTEPKRVADLFLNMGVNGNTKVQFRNGRGGDGFPNGIGISNDNLIPLAADSAISDFDKVVKKLSILVPEAFLGKSLGELSDINQPKPVAPKKKAFKCYRIDPEKDVIDDQIMVDPETGQSLKDTMTQEALDSAGGDLSLLNADGVNAPGMMPGDWQHIIFIIITVVVTIFLVLDLGYIAQLFFIKKDYHNGLMQLVIFIIVLVGITLLGLFINNKSDLEGINISNGGSGIDRSPGRIGIPGLGGRRR